MTEEELDRLQALADAATPGPWFVHPRSGTVCHGNPDNDRENYDIDDPENIDFIAASRQAVPELIAEVRRLRAEWDKICTSFHAMNTPSGRELELAEEVRRLLAVEKDLAFRLELALRQRDLARMAVDDLRNQPRGDQDSLL